MTAFGQSDVGFFPRRTSTRGRAMTFQLALVVNYFDTLYRDLKQQLDCLLDLGLVGIRAYFEDELVLFRDEMTLF